MAKIFNKKGLPQISEKTLEIVARIKVGAKPKFDFDFHAPLLIQVFDRGDDIAMFCSTAGIGRSTFFEWIQKYPEFAEAYEAARECSRTKWESVGGLAGVIDNSFNTTLWSINMRNRFDYTEHRRLKIKALQDAKTAEEQQQAIMAEIASGNLTGPESMQMLNVVLASVKVEENTQMRKDMEAFKEHMSGKE